ncbi:pentatricopeptide repeat-containing protein At1g73400, mitochondrial-like [Ananas comosus]|uniref:Pentatricopeptide repeat-containing protein At1g73400, mitochondrial-like n=1 Tax=Ananas comosus TaxID=4615 RepID=A0A199W7D7_ANACO|nr:pentatricopeptide repeat-containing protein At1g73400, mitochondrial-like [Ananas comosus]XP_020086469.1 pentatricopeptide repeat-containing protein At1g73400, mitochondrial-like [Ananas comosus]OAY85156.1 Pentatricopeptide repeat-containing protein, mitochondrial [Ananas comosus]
MNHKRFSPAFITFHRLCRCSRALDSSLIPSNLPHPFNSTKNLPSCSPSTSSSLLAFSNSNKLFALSRSPFGSSNYLTNRNQYCTSISSFAIRSFSCVNSSDFLILDEPNKCTSTISQESRLVSDSDRVYEAIISTCSSDQNLEKTLDSLNIELTTELVNDVLNRLRYEEKLAFRFFTWVGHQEGYEHEPQTYNDMIDILSSTRYKARQFGIVCDILDHMKRKNKNSVPLDGLLTILKTYAEKHLTHLRKFAKKKRIRMKTPPEIDAFNILLDALCKCSLVKEAELMFHRVKNKLVPNAETYNILFFGWCRVRDPKKAMKVLEEMLERGHTPENFTYNAAIDSFCSAGMVSEARELFEFMRTKGSTISSPTAKTYSIMIIALAKYDMVEESFRLLGDMRMSGCLPDVSTYKEMIEGMCLAGQIDAAYKVLDEMGKTGFPPDILTYNCFLKILCNLKRAEEALRLCERMVVVGCEPSVHTYNMLILMFFDMGETDRAIDVWLEMDKRGCERVVDSYGIMIDGLFDSGRVDNACSLLEEVMDRGLKLPYKQFDGILLRLSAIGNLNAIHRVSEHMRKFYNVAMARRFAISQKKKSMSLRRR